MPSSDRGGGGGELPQPLEKALTKSNIQKNRINKDPVVPKAGNMEAQAGGAPRSGQRVL